METTYRILLLILLVPLVWFIRRGPRRVRRGASSSYTLKTVVDENRVYSAVVQKICELKPSCEHHQVRMESRLQGEGGLGLEPSERHALLRWAEDTWEVQILNTGINDDHVLTVRELVSFVVESTSHRTNAT